MMVNQILAVIDDRNLSNVARGGRGGGWIVQIFYHPDNKMSVEGTMYPGIQRLIKRGRVVLTPIPLEFKKMKRKVINHIYYNLECVNNCCPSIVTIAFYILDSSTESFLFLIPYRSSLLYSSNLSNIHTALHQFANLSSVSIP